MSRRTKEVTSNKTEIYSSQNTSLEEAESVVSAKTKSPIILDDVAEELPIDERPAVESPFGVEPEEESESEESSLDPEEVDPFGDTWET